MNSITSNAPATESGTTVNKECRICGTAGPHAAYTAREMMFGLRDPFEYFECNFCGCLQIKDFPRDISPYYPKNYYTHTVSPEEHFANPIRSTLLKARARYDLYGRGIVGRLVSKKRPEQTARCLRAINPSLESSILDVGCGNGIRLYLLREIGFQNLLGVDPFIPGDHTYKNGLRIEKKSLNDVSGRWDIIMFHHSFEHIDCPLETLRQVRLLLKPSGRCIIRIPVASSYAWRHYRTDWVQLDAPRHYFLHSRTSVEHLARAADFRVTSVLYDSTEFQFLGSELYRRDIPLAGHPKLFRKSEVREFRSRAEELNVSEEGDSAAFYLAPSARPGEVPEGDHPRK
jgi:SAM-dependent methyltransferase